LLPLDITEAVLADYQSKGRLMPQWRTDVADLDAFAQRSLCTQINETDLAFLQRLWAEEGLGLVHQARNNLSADVQAGLQHLLGSVVRPGQQAATANASDEPLYEARFSAQRTRVPVRPRLMDAQGRLVHARPTVWGTQTALVVGLDDAPIHTDRDARIKLQFHWQRGAQASHRLNAPMDDNAPASDASGTWVRVAQSSWAGANWGGVFIPRLGQEVLVEFVDGDIDRPIIVGATYNGEGQPDAQGNRVNAGAAGATGNAPAWFPGSARQGAHEGHAHTATLSGFKSQSLDASQAGSGGHNQLVLDDSCATMPS
jgi:type VI secretion system secreted protein VgrG